MNIANVGRFSSDRTVREYADDIWYIKAKRMKKFTDRNFCY